MDARIPTRTRRGSALALDSITVAAIADELSRALVGGRVQKITRAEDSTYGLEIYRPGRRHQLALVARQGEPSLHLSAARVGSGEVTPSPMLLLMRKYLMGARVMAVEQDGVERAVTITFGFPAHEEEPPHPPGLAAVPPLHRVERGPGGEGETADRKLDGEGYSRIPHPAFGTTLPLSERGAGGEGLLPSRPGSRLIVELIPRFGNLILTNEDGLILDCEHRVAPGPDRVRTLLPRHQYEPPPPVDRPSLLDATQDQIEQALASVAPGLANRMLTSAFAGVSPALAREAARRAVAAGEAGPAGIAAALAGLAGLWRRRAWEPGAAEAEGQVAAVAPYRLTGVGEWRPTETMSAALERGSDRARRQRPIDIARRAALAALAKRRRAVAAKLDSLRLALQSGERAESLRLDGETVLAHLHSITRGQNRLLADGRDIALDPALGPSANAQAMFKRYRKAKAALANVPRLIEQTERQLEYIDSQAALVGVAESAEDVRAIARESTSAFRRPGAPEKARGKTRASRQIAAPLRVVADDGTEILVGRSAKQNEQVTFEIASPDDVWLHARGVGGAHVIVRCGARQPSPETLIAAAVLAARHSAAATDSVVAVDWTRRRHVRRIAGYAGLVTYREETVVRVSPGEKLT